MSQQELKEARKQGEQDRERKRGFLDRYKDPSKAQAYREGYYSDRRKHLTESEQG